MPELDRNNRIKAELDRLTALILPMDENIHASIAPLLENAAFMKVALDDLQQTIIETGPVEHYQNGQHQSGMKVSAAVQSYNQIIRNYCAVIKSIIPYVQPAQQQRLKAIVSTRNSSEHRPAADISFSRTHEIMNVVRKYAKKTISWREAELMADEGLTDEEALQRVIDQGSEE